MKKIIIFLLAFSLVLTACKPEQIPDKDQPIDDKNIPADAECTSDSDCVKGGCSGTICQSKDSPPMFTTCEFRPEYACYKQIDCGCINYKCQWEKTTAFEDCMEEAKT